MTKDQLIKLVENPSKIDEQSFLAIEKLREDFPYSYPLALLKLLHLKQNDSYLFTPALSKTALLSPDREKLWHWVEGEVQEKKTVLRVEKSQPTHVVDPPAKAEEKEEVVKEEKTPVQETESPEKTETPPVKKEEKTLANQGSELKDLSHLPEKVRAIIERSRNIQKKIQEPKEEHVEKGNVPESIASFKLEEPIEVEPLSVSENEDLNISFSILEDESDFLGVPNEVEEEIEEDLTDEVTPKSIVEKEIILEGKHSFVEWMELMSSTEVSKGKIHDDKPREVIEEAKTSPKTLEEKIDLIDQFIKKPPRFKPVKKSGNNIDLLKMTTSDDSAFITETLAQVYLDQKHFDKAIEAYEILRLKYPEKSSLFADRISDIKKIKENK